MLCAQVTPKAAPEESPMAKELRTILEALVIAQKSFDFSGPVPDDSEVRALVLVLVMVVLVPLAATNCRPCCCCVASAALLPTFCCRFRFCWPSVPWIS